MRLCSIPGCSNKHLAIGFCRAHYLRNYKRGSTELLVMRGVPMIERVMAKVKKRRDGCWIFTGRIAKNGYGRINQDRGPSIPAHRATYEHKYGLVPAGKELDHTCRVRRCCNPDHVEPVTHLENVRRGNAGMDWPTRPRSAKGQFLPTQKGLI